MEELFAVLVRTNTDAQIILYSGLRELPHQYGILPKTGGELRAWYCRVPREHEVGGRR